MTPRSSAMKSAVAFAILTAFLAAAPRGAAQGPDLKSKLEASYKLTKPTDDKTDIVTAGSVLILQKDKLLMYATTNSVMPQNTFKDGKLSSGGFGANEKLNKIGGFFGKQPPSQLQVTSRGYVTGEKFWVTKIDYPQDGVLFTLFTDAVNDVRYNCTLKFIYPKGVQLTADQVISLVASVLKVQTDDAQGGDTQQAQGGDQQGQQQGQAGGGDQQQAAAPADQQQAAAPADQTPPPPTTVEIGQSIDQVVGILGTPDKIINLGVKQIYVYKDIKVTFIKGKVTDAQ